MHLADVPLGFALVGLAFYTVLGGADFGAGFWQLLGGRGEFDGGGGENPPAVDLGGDGTAAACAHGGAWAHGGGGERLYAAGAPVV